MVSVLEDPLGFQEALSQILCEIPSETFEFESFFAKLRVGFLLWPLIIAFVGPEQLQLFIWSNLYDENVLFLP